MKVHTGFWRKPGYIAWFTADTATAVGMAMHSLAISLIGYALSMFCSAAAGSLLPVCGFNRTILVFLSAMLVSAAIVVLYRPLRTIPRTDVWDSVELR